MIPQLNLPGLKSEAGRKVLRPHVRLGAIFYPHANDPIFPSRSTSPIPVTWDFKKTRATLREFSWSKVGGQPAGQWSVVIKETAPGNIDFKNGDILSDDWVDLSVIRNGVQIPVCTGIVDTVTEATRGFGGTAREWVMTGRDHGALWQFPITFHNIYLQSLNELTTGLYTKRVRGRIGGDPATVFKILIEAAFARGTSSSIWQLPPSFARAKTVGENSILDILKINNKTKTRGGWYNELQFWTQLGEGLGQTIENWCNPLLNEMFYDLDIDKNYLATGKSKSQIAAFIRERPFLFVDHRCIESTLTGDSWFKLPTWEIPNWLVQTATVGRSGAERFNIFELLADIGLSGEKEQQAMGLPIWDENSIKRHGIRPMIETTRYVSGGNKGVGKWAIDRKAWQLLLTNWYCLNPWFLSGSITFKVMLPEIRFGDRLRIKAGKDSEDTTFYVEGVRHGFRAGDSPTSPPTSTTTVMVSRGFKGTDNDLIKALRTVTKRYKDIATAPYPGQN